MPFDLKGAMIMPSWFIYKFPEDPFEPSSYYLVKGTPRSIGIRLSAIFAEVVLNTDPAVPLLNKSMRKAIKSALKGQITDGITLLRP